MSISAALSNSLTGLNAASRTAETISTNVANALTEGFGRREVSLSSQSVNGAGAGVQFDGVVRVVDQLLLRDRRFADADVAYADSEAALVSRINAAVGASDELGSLSDRIARLQTAFIDAASRPDLENRLAALSDTASALAAKINDISGDIQSVRQDADSQIAGLVNDLNDELLRVEDLNAQIVALSGRGRDVSALEDQRQVAIDRISEIVPVSEIPGDGGRVSLVTKGGYMLLEQSAPAFSFAQTSTVVADMTVASGALATLERDGAAIAVNGEIGPFSGGRLAAAFSVRDGRAVEMQAQIDALARDLIERFEDPAVDPTLTAGAAGVFTDLGAALDPADTVGLAGRLRLNAALDPTQGGDVTAWRNGLAAAAPLDVGDATQITSYFEALTSARAPSDTAITTVSDSFGGLSDAMTGNFAQIEGSIASRQGAAEVRQQALQKMEGTGAVNTDAQLQRLLLVEQSYAANARVIQTVDELIQRLIGP